MHGEGQQDFLAYLLFARHLACHHTLVADQVSCDHNPSMSKPIRYSTNKLLWQLTWQLTLPLIDARYSSARSNARISDDVSKERVEVFRREFDMVNDYPFVV